MNKEELDTILEKHLHWIEEDCEGWENMRADLTGANLNFANLTGADLRVADLACANLCGANLTGAYLYKANLTDADLRSADLRGADLRGANLIGADLRGADLSSADLRGADFYYPLHCPSTGSFTGYKKALYKREDGKIGYCLITLSIPADARRSSATSSKCRCDKAYVTNMWSIDEDSYGKNVNVAYSCYDNEFKYERELLLTVEDFCEDRWQECAPGIHFFMDDMEAERYPIL